MGLVKKIAATILVISFVVFVALFGRLPALRNTPIGALHRLLLIHIPAWIRKVDQLLTHGRVSAWVERTAHVLWNDRHPTVMIFFILLFAVSEIMFLPPAFPLMDNFLKVRAIIAVMLPYVFLYLSANTDPGYITPGNNHQAMTLYPYDHTIFHPGQTCRTCHILKPARSKHCSICKRCISKLDHHCIFINSCVGYHNQRYFVLLLLTTGILTVYATKVGLSLLSSQIFMHLPKWNLLGSGFTWSEYFQIWAWALQENVRIGAVTLLCLLLTPLVWAFLGYHMYLIWAGTTTNESMKWSDWQADMSDGFAWKRTLPQDRPRDPSIEPECDRWPCESLQILMQTEDGDPPRGEGAIGVGQWEQVWRLKDVENLYDLGFWDNLMDVFFLA